MDTSEADLKSFIAKSCSSCQSTTSIVWHRQGKSNSDNWLCNFCQTKKRISLADNVMLPSNPSTALEEEMKVDECSSSKSQIKSKFSPANRKTKSAAAKSRQNSQKPTTRTSRQNSVPVVNKVIAWTRSKPTRKHLRKPDNPEKSILQNATVSTSGLLWHNGVLFSEGDIVSIIDEVDNRLYYARIRGLLKDHFSNKYAALTWLLPKSSANLDAPFDIAEFVSGPRDEKLYDINCLEFVCRIPKKIDAASHHERKYRMEANADDDINPEKQFAGV